MLYHDAQIPTAVKLFLTFTFVTLTVYGVFKIFENHYNIDDFEKSAEHLKQMVKLLKRQYKGRPAEKEEIDDHKNKLLKIFATESHKQYHFRLLHNLFNDISDLQK